MATKLKNGQVLTLSTTEGAYVLDGDRRVPETIAVVLVSGSCQATVVPGASETPVLDTTYATWSTAGDKFLLTVAANSTIRFKTASAGVVNVNW